MCVFYYFKTYTEKELVEKITNELQNELDNELNISDSSQVSKSVAKDVEEDGVTVKVIYSVEEKIGTKD